MGVPVLIGVCSQTGSSPPSSSFSITSFTTVTVSYGTGLGNQINVPLEQTLTTVLNQGNAFTVPEGGLRSFYNEENFGIPLNNSFTPIIDGSGITASDLPADGACEVTYVFTFDPERFPIKIYSLEFEQVQATSPVSMTFDGLNRSQLTGAGSELPSLLTANDFSVIAPTPGDSADPSINVEIKILKSDGSFITQNQNIITDEQSIAPVLVEG